MKSPIETQKIINEIAERNKHLQSETFTNYDWLINLSFDEMAKELVILSMECRACKSLTSCLDCYSKWLNEERN